MQATTNNHVLGVKNGEVRPAQRWGVLLLVIAGMIAGMLVAVTQQLATAFPAYAATNTYPTSITGCRSVTGNPSGYFTCDLRDAGMDAYYDPWGEENRECTSYVAWMLHSANGFEMPFYDDAANWGTCAESMGYIVNMTPAVGSVYWTKSPQHVGWVEAVSSDGSSVVIEQYNADYTGQWSESAVATNSASGYIHFKDLASTSSGNKGNAYGLIDTTYAIYAQSQPGSGSWVEEVGSGNAPQFAMAGNYQIFLRSDGTVFAKNSIGQNAWTQETEPGTATAVAISSTGMQLLIRNDAVHLG